MANSYLSFLEKERDKSQEQQKITFLKAEKQERFVKKQIDAVEKVKSRNQQVMYQDEVETTSEQDGDHFEKSSNLANAVHDIPECGLQHSTNYELHQEQELMTPKRNRNNPGREQRKKRKK